MTRLLENQLKLALRFLFAKPFNLSVTLISKCYLNSCLSLIYRKFEHSELIGFPSGLAFSVAMTQSDSFAKTAVTLPN